VAGDVLGLAELRENVLREDLAELDAHLVCTIDAHQYMPGAGWAAETDRTS
jgi:hypothetical protein